MKLDRLISSITGATVSEPAGGVEVMGLRYDSRQVLPGEVFVALPGAKADGKSFIRQAVENRASAIVCEGGAPGVGVPVVTVPNARLALAEAASAFYGAPDRKLKMVGITGTNGKTTTTFIVKSLLEALGVKTGLIGTVRYEVGDRTLPAARTTPESLDVYRLLAEMVAAGCGAAVMEVSSHALHQKRVHGVDFDLGIFSNLTQDHLDYHGTMEEYFQAKVILFRSLGRLSKQAAGLANADDPYGRRILQDASLAVPLHAYALEDETAPYRARVVSMNGAGTTVRFSAEGRTEEVVLPLTGRHNVYNALAALAAVHSLGHDFGFCARALAAVPGVPGRLQRVPTGADFDVFIDYAHTDDALKNALRTLREVVAGRLIVVFGCGGNRDAKKRPLMGAVAAALADMSILTSDNPRREDPAEILRQIETGFEDRRNYEVVEDRREAIDRALRLARAGDIVLVAGKGHETYQEFADRVVPFDDAEVVRECLEHAGRAAAWKR